MNDQSIIDQLSAQKLNVPAPQQPTQQPPQQQPAPPPAPTAAEKATAALDPKNNQSSDPFEFFPVDVNGKQELLTPSQIRGMASRYRDLNYKHQTEVAPIKNSIGFVNQLMQEAKSTNPNIGDEDVANFLATAVQAYMHNPQLGGQQPQQQNNGDIDRQNIPVQKPAQANPNSLEDQLSAWESENAVSLPPMYKDAIRQTSSLSGEVGQLKQMLQQILQASNNVAAGAQQNLDDAKQARSQAGMKQIGNNLKQAQMKYGLPDDAEQDFMSFAGERGYTIDDFIDPTLTDKLVGDFKSVINTPEMERLKAIASRRQAYTGNLSPAPGGGMAAPAAKPNPDQELISSMTDQAMKQRGGSLQ